MSTKLGRNRPFIYQFETSISSSSINVLSLCWHFVLLLKVSFTQLIILQMFTHQFLRLVQSRPIHNFTNTYPSISLFQYQLTFDTIISSAPHFPDAWLSENSNDEHANKKYKNPVFFEKFPLINCSFQISSYHMYTIVIIHYLFLGLHPKFKIFVHQLSLSNK